jgi:hypothetical protein
MDCAKFFASVRPTVFDGHLSQSQVDGINTLLSECETQSLSAPSTAYVLATAFHETAQTMQPIAEYGKGKGRAYGKPGHNHGQIPYGRGFVQTTWDANYEKTDRELGLGGRMIANYDLLLTDISLAAKAAVTGMVEGWYTSKKLSDYFNAKTTDSFYQLVFMKQPLTDAQRAALASSQQALSAALQAPSA